MLRSDAPQRVPPRGHTNFDLVPRKPTELHGPPRVAVRLLSWEASAPGLSIQVFEAGTLRKGQWGTFSLQLYPIMIAMGTAGSWQLDPRTPVHFVSKYAHGRLCIANQTDHEIDVYSLILWCDVRPRAKPRGRAK